MKQVWDQHKDKNNQSRQSSGKTSYVCVRGFLYIFTKNSRSEDFSDWYNDPFHEMLGVLFRSPKARSDFGGKNYPVLLHGALNHQKNRVSDIFASS